MPQPAARTVAALDRLAESLEVTSAELRALATRVRRLRRSLDAGKPLHAALAVPQQPLMVARLTEITDRLQEAGSGVRRAAARQLRAEGLTQSQIAELFGVTRQRVAALLKPPSRRKPKRPRR